MAGNTWKTKFENEFKDINSQEHTAIDFIKYIGPGLIVTVGFIDPGNWATNVAAGSTFGYSILWVITLSTLMLIALQHNAAHLGIATGLCLSEASIIHTKKLGKYVLVTAMLASIATAMAEILGGAIALKMLFSIPLQLGSIMVGAFVFWMLFGNSYKRIEKYIIGLVSLVGLSFIYELTLVHINWGFAATSWVVPSLPKNSLPLIMSVLGAVVMPHNLFLHSEIIQSRQWNLENDSIIKKQLKFEFADTLFSMVIGWAINSAMILMAAAVFFSKGQIVTELDQAHNMLVPLLGNNASIMFALALLFAGTASSVTAGMAGGSIFSGMFKEPYDIKDIHTKLGVGITILGAVIITFLISNPFQGLIMSQMLLSVQLPITIFMQIYLTSSKKVMGKFKNSIIDNIVLWIIAIVVTFLNIMLLLSYIFPNR